MIGEKIKELRVGRNITQQELAGELGKNQQSVSDWERNVSNVPIPVLLKICRLFGVKLSHFDDAINEVQEEREEKPCKS